MALDQQVCWARSSTRRRLAATIQRNVAANVRESSLSAPGCLAPGSASESGLIIYSPQARSYIGQKALFSTKFLINLKTEASFTSCHRLPESVGVSRKLLWRGQRIGSDHRFPRFGVASTGSPGSFTFYITSCLLCRRLCCSSFLRFCRPFWL